MKLHRIVLFNETALPALARLCMAFTRVPSGIPKHRDVANQNGPSKRCFRGEAQYINNFPRKWLISLYRVACRMRLASDIHTRFTHARAVASEVLRDTPSAASCGRIIHGNRDVL